MMQITKEQLIEATNGKNIYCGNIKTHGHEIMFVAITKADQEIFDKMASELFPYKEAVSINLES